MRTAYTTTLTILRDTMGKHGDPASTQEIDVPGCVVVPGVTGTVTPGRAHGEGKTFQDDIVTYGLFVLWPARTDIRSSDRVRYEGTVYGVQGEPVKLKSPISGRRPGVQTTLSTATG